MTGILLYSSSDTIEISLWSNNESVGDMSDDSDVLLSGEYSAILSISGRLMLDEQLSDDDLLEMEIESQPSIWIISDTVLIEQFMF